MKAIVLVDNIPQDDMRGEWGLSIYIEYGEQKILLDTGATSLYLENAEKLGVDLSQVDYAVLSHAHYDHAGGMKGFFELNRKAPFYLRAGTRENCYKWEKLFPEYIGVPRRILTEYRERIRFAEGDFCISPQVSLIPHKTPDLSQVGKKNRMYIRRGLSYRYDDFAHEQSLVFDTEEGLVIFNSCCHAGADVVIREVTETYPDKKVKALIGGFHLSKRTDEEVRELAERIRQVGNPQIYTGHCTGERACKILREELGNTVKQLQTGMVMEL